MAKNHHPIRDCEIRVYTGEHGAVAFFDDGRAFPIHFRAETDFQVVQKAEAFRAAIIAKHEKTFLRLQEARVRASERRRKKAA